MKKKKLPILTKQVIYLNGPQGSGKSTLVALFRDAVEINMSDFTGWPYSRLIDNFSNTETIIFTSQVNILSSSENLKHICDERGINYTHISTNKLNK